MKPCNQCGKCCIHYADGGLFATAEEIDYWEQNRPDIYQYVHFGQIWHSPQTGAPLTQCPWLQKSGSLYSCGIYEDRPQDCRSYPVTVEDMVRDECEMLEIKDLADLASVQAKLDFSRD